MGNQIKDAITSVKNRLQKETLVDLSEHFWSFLGAFIGIGLIAFIQSHSIPYMENVFLIGSFGASSVLVFGAVQSPFAQPRNLIMGNIISSIIGVTVGKVCPDIIWLTAPLAVSLSIVFMQITKTVHPPAGATALIAVMSGAKIKALGYGYVISPVLSGALILLVVALIFNNIPGKRKYPANGGLARIFNRNKTGV